jgi:hypothetical protein
MVALTSLRIVIYKILGQVHMGRMDVHDIFCPWTLCISVALVVLVLRVLLVLKTRFEFEELISWDQLEIFII